MKIIVRAKPAAAEEKVEELGHEQGIASFSVSVKEPPIEGRANRAIVAALAHHFRVPIAHIKIISGHTSRIKIIEIPQP
ncbi:DUF167 domain-containing protein [Candidatus Uhrbacteria bacterium]|nr:DUF167 domain-containing protein [Candidatus Uhrbacteria bacterium]